ncbi:hypothetical protein VP511E551_P0038 [Vibrio phage 511E55-1]|nr:hypothetical protein VP511E551_P0038 [Vibrio phage 511E55-1]
MKNKQAKQMMVDCGNTELAFMMMQKEIGTRCESLKKKGIYDFSVDMSRIANEALKKRSHLFAGRVDGVPFDAPNSSGIKALSIIID